MVGLSPKDSSQTTLQTEVVSWQEVSGGSRLLEGFLRRDIQLDQYLPPHMARIEQVLERREGFIRGRVQRDDLVAALRPDLERWDAPDPALRNLDHLASPDTLCVITGQQAGLLTGPLYTFYKAVGAIHLAEQLTRTHGVRFVPVFWMASEDHDLEEVRWIDWFDRQGDLVQFEVETADVPAGTPAADLPASRFTWERFQEWRDEVLHKTEFFEEVNEFIKDHHNKSESWSDFFARLLVAFLGERGLVVLDATNPALRKLAQPFFQRELEDPLRTTELVSAASEELTRRKVAPSLHRPPERCSFFVMEDGLRKPVDYIDGKFHVGDRQVARFYLENWVEEHPERFSPSAVLRPVIQDAILPVAVSVLGPGEIDYHSLLADVYKRHDVPRPCAALRPGLTLVENRVSRRLDRHNIRWKDLGEDEDALVKRLTSSPELETLRNELSHVRDQFEEATSVITDLTESLDKELAKPVQKDLSTIIEKLDHIESLATRRVSSTDQKTRKDVALMKEAVIPEGEPQERRINLFYFLYKYGLPFANSMITALGDVQPGRHAIATFRTDENKPGTEGGE